MRLVEVFWEEEEGMVVLKGEGEVDVVRAEDVKAGELKDVHLKEGWEELICRAAEVD